MAEFEPYGTSHFIALVGAFAAAVAVWKWAALDRGRSASWLAIVLVFHEAINIALHGGVYGYPWADSIPLNFCRANMLVCAWMLWRRSFLAFEVGYFWAAVGAPVALLTPDLKDAFPHPLFFTFFVGHALGLIAVAYAIGGFEFAPRLSSIAKSFAAAVGLAMLAVPINRVLGTNYLYLVHPPANKGLLSVFEPWPGYLAGIAIFGLLCAVVVWLPFAGRSRRSVPQSPAN